MSAPTPESKTPRKDTLLAKLEARVQNKSHDALFRTGYMIGAKDALELLEPELAEARSAVLEEATEWCAIERNKLGAVDGYDYKSGEEYGLRRAEIYLQALKSADPQSKEERNAVLGLRQKFPNDESLLRGRAWAMTGKELLLLFQIALKNAAGQGAPDQVERRATESGPAPAAPILYIDPPTGAIEEHLPTVPSKEEAVSAPTPEFRPCEDCHCLPKCTVDCLRESLAEAAYIDQGWQRYERGYEGFNEAHEVAPDGRLIHYKEPQYEWRKR